MAPPLAATEDFQHALNQVIYASRAISDINHLKGRDEEVACLARALLTPGRQPFIYGLRGAGKTSLALSVSRQYSHTTNVQITCAPQMKFGDIIRSLAAAAMLQNPLLAERKFDRKGEAALSVPFVKAGSSISNSDTFKGVPTPQDPNEAFALLSHVTSEKGQRFTFIIDEFDQLTDTDTHLQIGLLAKLIADSGSAIKMILCGVADDVQQIFKAHPSTLRLFEPVEVNRLKLQACFDIMSDVEKSIGVTIERETQFRIAQISDGFPYFIHLIIEKTLWRWYSRGIARPAYTQPEDYEQGLIDASRAAAPELKDPYELAASRYALDGELLIWAIADGGLLEKQIKVIAKDFERIHSTFHTTAKPDKCLNQNQVGARLGLFRSPAYGKMVTSPRRSYYAFTEKRMRGYARLRAALLGVQLGADHPFSNSMRTL